jgi:error-prone DNA polymerase
MAYVELHCHSNFSFLDGASPPEELVRRAAALGYPALALTDHDGFYGAVRFHQAARDYGIDPIIGAEITLEGDAHLLLLVRNAEGYAHLSSLISAAQLSGQKGRARASRAMLSAHSEGLVALSGCAEGEIPRALLAGREDRALRLAAEYRELFGSDHFFLELQHHSLPISEKLCAGLARVGAALGIPCVATNNVHYADPDGRRLADVVACIRHHTDLDSAGTLLFPNAERYLKPAAAMARQFAAWPGAVENSLAVAAQCTFALENLPVALPAFAVPAGETPDSHLAALTHAGAEARWGTPDARQRAQLEHELRVIARLNLAGYFLIVWDIARFCRERGILCQGRGSAANSAVCYCLGITAVDPVRLKLLFERFMSEERREPPDIDIDIANDRREEVIQYVYEKYGRDHAAMVCEIISYRGRSAAREVGKALGFSAADIDRLAKLVDHYSRGEKMAERAREAELNLEDRRVRLWIELARKIQGFPRHLGIHVGGMIVTATPLSRVVPLERATFPGRSVIQWDKDDAQAAGLIKIDLLGLGMLALIARALAHIRQRHGVKVDPAQLSYDDPKVYDLLCSADTVGVFQVESRAQMNTLPRHRPRRFYDLVVEVALIRPGPIQGKMVHPYLRRRNGEEPVTYTHPSLEPILERTLGIPLFQEQGMQVAVAAAGFTATQADELRRAMGHKRSREKMEALSVALVEGMHRNGIDREAARRIFEQLSAFADFGFAESHAASFAFLVYVSAWLKVYYPLEFYCALLNAQPMGFYSPSTIVFEARRRGVKVLGVDVNRSAWDCTAEDDALRLGFKYIKKLGPAARQQIEPTFATRPFASVEDFARQTRLPRDVLEQVAMVGAFRGFGLTRRQALWKVMALSPGAASELPLAVDERGAEQMPPLFTAGALVADFKGLDLSTGPHPMALFRARLKRKGILTAAQLHSVADRSQVQVAGMVIIRQRPWTAKGFLFLTLEDETGFINVVVKPDRAERFHRILARTGTLLVTGRIEKETGVINVVGDDFRPLRVQTDTPALKSRDFR